MSVHKRFRRFLRDEAGAITVEFVIVLPLLILLVTFIAFASLLIAAASEVQQIAHELARASVRYVDATPAVVDICAQLRTDVLPGLIVDTLTVDPTRLVLLPCAGQPDGAGYMRVTVTYDFAGSVVQSLGQNFGLDLGVIMRRAVTYI